MADLCQRTSLNLFGRHFKRFSGLLELLQELTREEIESISRQTSAELEEMVQIEKSSIYLSNETEPEFERYMRLLKKE